MYRENNSWEGDPNAPDERAYDLPYDLVDEHAERYESGWKRFSEYVDTLCVNIEPFDARVSRDMSGGLQALMADSDDFEALMEETAKRNAEKPPQYELRSWQGMKAFCMTQLGYGVTLTNQPDWIAGTKENPRIINYIGVFGGSMDETAAVVAGACDTTDTAAGLALRFLFDRTIRSDNKTPLPSDAILELGDLLKRNEDPRADLLLRSKVLQQLHHTLLLEDQVISRRNYREFGGIHDEPLRRAIHRSCALEAVIYEDNYAKGRRLLGPEEVVGLMNSHIREIAAGLNSEDSTS